MLRVITMTAYRRPATLRAMYSPRSHGVKAFVNGCCCRTSNPVTKRSLRPFANLVPVNVGSW